MSSREEKGPKLAKWTELCSDERGGNVKVFVDSKRIKPWGLKIWKCNTRQRHPFLWTKPCFDSPSVLPRLRVWVGLRLSAGVAFLVSSAGFQHLCLTFYSFLQVFVVGYRSVFSRSLLCTWKCSLVFFVLVWFLCPFVLRSWAKTKSGFFFPVTIEKKTKNKRKKWSRRRKRSHGFVWIDGNSFCTMAVSWGGGHRRRCCWTTSTLCFLLYFLI